MLSGCKINILQDEVLNVNLESKTANLKVSGQTNFDYVVFATGSEVVYFNMQEYKNLFYTIDNRQNILKLRQRLITEIANCKAVNVNVIGAGQLAPRQQVNLHLQLRILQKV
jgi:NADH dehydrogenase FAD-containing subunit